MYPYNYFEDENPDYNQFATDIEQQRRGDPHFGNPLRRGNPPRHDNPPHHDNPPRRGNPPHHDNPPRRGNPPRHGNPPPFSGMIPSQPPPQLVPVQPPSLYAVDPYAIRGCLYRFTYIWLGNGIHFWMFPTYVGRSSVSGYRWSRRGWQYFGIDLDEIRSFSCN